MKKTLAVLAVLAVAAVAQAELLATWNFDGANNTGLVSPNANAANSGQVTFTSLTRVNGLTTASTQSGNFTANNWGNGTGTGATAPAIEFTLNVASGYEVVESVIAVKAINGNNSGPAQVQWALNGTDVGSAWASTSAAGSSKNTGDGFTVSAGNNIFHLYSNTTKGNNGNAVGSTAGRVNLKTSMTFDGKIQPASSPTPSVPEPATMSLLGIGALALALRRKLRK